MRKYISFLIITGLFLSLTSAQAEERKAEAQQQEQTLSPQPSYSSLKSPIKARIIDRRFYTKEAMYLANEMNQTGDIFLRRALIEGLPVADDNDFQYMTGVESYWYSRYNMQALVAESRLGVAVVHGPYVTEKAIQLANSLYNRDRGEDVLSNKEALFRHLIPAYLARTGFPRRFEDASPLMIEYASGDPHFTRPVDKRTNFEMAENLWREKELKRLYGAAYTLPPHEMGEGGNEFWRYRIAYRDNFESLRWDNDKMDHFIDMGGVGQALMKAILWMEYFFRQTHHGKYLGNNAEDGFRGAMLTLNSVSKMLLLKGALLYDANKNELVGVNPFEYDPQKRLCYFPHEISVKCRYIGDLPPRQEEFKVKDKTSQLFDQASLLWSITEYFYFSDPNRDRSDKLYRTAFANWDKVFGDDPPYDGSLMERKYMHLARGLANLILKNIDFMHKDAKSGVLVSEWHPKTKTGTKTTVQDLGMTILALANYRLHLKKAEPELSKLAGDLLKVQADFLVDRLQNPDGSLPDGYDFATNTKLGDKPTLLAQGFAVRGLLKAYEELNDPRYLEAAKKAYNFMNEVLWNKEAGIYRSGAGAEVSVYTPMSLGAALGAMREMILITKDVNEIQRFKRFWVQAVNSSGIQQSEYEETGEVDFTKADGDGDGIPRMDFAHGKYGVAPVYAAKVEIETTSASTQIAKK